MEDLVTGLIDDLGPLPVLLVHLGFLHVAGQANVS